jgi:hypothetical protein
MVAEYGTAEAADPRLVLFVIMDRLKDRQSDEA